MKISRGMVVTIGLLLLLCAVFLSVYLNPLRAPPERIRATLLRETPLGTSIEQVRAFVDSHYGPNRTHVESKGFLKQDGGESVAVGVTSVEADLGQYYDIPFPFPVFVTAYWGFDQRGRLIDVRVMKTADGP